MPDWRHFALRTSTDDISVKSLRSRLAVALAVVAAFAGGAGFVAVRSGLTTTVTMVTVPPPATVTAAVESRVLEDIVVTRGNVAVTEVVSILWPSVDEGRPVVTSMEAVLGGSVDEGELVASVAGRPVFVFEGLLPAYRELARGSDGIDVIQLQEALARLGYYVGEIDGVYGRATAASVRDLYVDNGYEPDSGSAVVEGGDTEQVSPRRAANSASVRIPLDEVAFVPKLPADVVMVYVKIGDVPIDGSALMDVATGEVRIQTTVPATRIAGIEVGSVAVILDEASGAEFEAEVVDVATEPRSDSGRLEYDVELRPRGFANDLVGTNVRVSFTLVSSDGPVLVVPITAVWTGDGDNVFVTVSDGETTRNTSVTLGIVVGGWVEITEADGRLSEGDRVVVTR